MDWSTVPLGNAIVLRRGFDLPHRNRRAGGVPVVSSSGISGNHDIAQVQPPGVVTGRYGTIGEVFYVEEPFWPLNTTLYVRDFKGNDPRFVAFLLQTIDYKSHSGKSGVPGVNRNDLHKLEVHLPPVPEQRLIAKTLHDVDKAVDALDRLVLKRGAMQQGAMQQLLVGATRLPGFTDPWAERRLADIAEIVSGATPSTRNVTYWGGGIPWCTPTDITADSGRYLRTTERTITEAGLASCAARLLPAGALLLCSRATIGEVKIAAVPVATNQGFKSLVVRPGVSNEFLFYLLHSLKPKMVERAIGSTFLEIGKRDVGAIAAPMPAHDEQCAIAAVLSDMDDEIAALEHRRQKIDSIRRGMMQALLTGRVRLAPARAGT